MKTPFLTLCIIFISILGYGQQSFIGIQNSPRKGMLHAAMNPAELSNLSRNIEVNLFSVGGLVSNNAISFQDIIGDGNFFDLAVNQSNNPLNMRGDLQVMGPSIGFKTGKWAFGFVSQVMVKGNVIDLDTDIARALHENEDNTGTRTDNINSPLNQRVNAAGYTELGFLASREIFSNTKHTLSAGATLKLLIPAVYMNMGIDNLNATIIQNDDEFTLTNTTGELNVNYPEEIQDRSFIDYGRDNFSISDISGIGLDLGLSHLYKINGKTKLSSGISLRNLGAMNLRSDQINNTYTVNIPQNSFFRLDLLEGTPAEIEDQLLSSGYFTRTSSANEQIKSRLPSILSAYTDVMITKNFQIGIYGQSRMSNQSENLTLSTQNVLALTPRFVFGLFEIYSPWAVYEVSGATGGLGLRLGGFFLGSQSVITGLLANTKQADFHIGFSMGFGGKNVE
jgi:hypothetical protein